MNGVKIYFLSLLSILTVNGVAVGAESADYYMGGVEVADVSSTLQSGDDYYKAGNMVDLLPASSWCAGDARDSNHWIYFRSILHQNDKYESVKLLVSGGYTKSNTVYYNNNRPKTIKITVYGVNGRVINKSEDKIILEDRVGLQSLIVNLEEKAYLSDLMFKVEVLDVYSGMKYDDLCISEIKLVPVKRQSISISEELSEIEKESSIYFTELDGAAEGEVESINKLIRLAYGYYIQSAEGSETLAETYLDIFLKFPARFAYILTLQEGLVKNKISRFILNPISDKFSDKDIYDAACKAYKEGVRDDFLDAVIKKNTN